MRKKIRKIDESIAGLCYFLLITNKHFQGIVSLCLLFEKLLQTHEPELWSHFREIQIQP